MNLKTGLVTAGLSGAGVVIGVVFGARPFLSRVARNLSLRAQLFSYAILGFALFESASLLFLCGFFEQNSSALLTVAPIVYANADTHKESILKDNKGKSGFTAGLILQIERNMLVVRWTSDVECIIIMMLNF